MSGRKTLLLILLSIFIVSSTGSAAHGLPKSTGDDLYKQIEIFSDAITAIQHGYVEIAQPKDIIYGALKGMLSSLDPYSQFMDPDIYKELQVETEGEFGGLGIEITIKDHLLTIITPLDGTPAEKIGLKAMDRIVKIEGKITKDITIIEAVKKLRGKPGTKVTLTIMRKDEPILKEFTITRAIIKIRPVRKATILEEDIGYIKLTDFSEKTKRDLHKELEKLEKEGMDSLILDLRNNPGGLLVSSVETASEFLATGQLVVSTKGRDKSQNVEYRARGKSNFKKIPLIVLINGGSASASEIVAGAIQDHKRGIIMGTNSFGKGSVQTVIPLRDGSALRLTTAKYYTPSGNIIDEDGITPDVIVELALIQKRGDKEEDVFEEIEQQEKQHPDELIPEEEEEEEEDFIKNDSQLRAAVDLMRGIKVYQNLQKVKKRN